MQRAEVQLKLLSSIQIEEILESKVLQALSSIWVV